MAAASLPDPDRPTCRVDGDEQELMRDWAGHISLYWTILQREEGLDRDLILELVSDYHHGLIRGEIVP